MVLLEEYRVTDNRFPFWKAANPIFIFIFILWFTFKERSWHLLEWHYSPVMQASIKMKQARYKYEISKAVFYAAQKKYKHKHTVSIYNKY